MVAAIVRDSGDDRWTTLQPCVYRHKTKKGGIVYYALIVILSSITSLGCVGVKQTDWVRLDGELCRTTRIKVVPYAGETETDCLQKGQVVQVTTSHDDLGMLGGIAAVVATLIATGL